MDNKTQNEQKVEQAAQGIKQATEKLQGGFQSLQDKVDNLIKQAQSPEPTPEPEDLSQEFAMFDEALSGLNSFADQLAGTSSSGGGSETPVSPVEDPASPVAPNPMATNEEGQVVNAPSVPASTENTSTPTPLAGVTGATNPIPDVELNEGEVYAAQPQPGLDPFAAQQEPEVQADDGQTELSEVPNEGQTSSSTSETPTSGNTPTVIDETIGSSTTTDDF